MSRDQAELIAKTVRLLAISYAGAAVYGVHKKDEVENLVNQAEEAEKLLIESLIWNGKDII